MAEAYRARDPDTGDLIAVYLFPDEFAESSRAPDRFTELLNLLVPREHPNILRVLDAGRDGRCGYVVTEWVEGTTLARMIEIQTRLPEANVIRFLAQVGQAMDFVRNGETALCRVSPANVLVRNDGAVKVIPFELPGQEATTPAAQPGVKSVPFEELIFSLGTTLHESLTGQAWVRPEPPPASSRRRRSYSAPPRAAGLTDRTERAIRRATDADPAKRPLTCADFLKLLRGRPLSAGAPKTDTRPPSASGENRRAFVRYSLGMGANCAIHTSVFDGDPATAEVWPLVVQDVSAGGIGILLARRCEPGTELSVELPSGTDREPRSLPARVVRVRKDQHGHWTHGCEFFTPLTEAELYALINCVAKSDTV